MDFSTTPHVPTTPHVAASPAKANGSAVLRGAIWILVGLTLVASATACARTEKNSPTGRTDAAGLRQPPMVEISWEQVSSSAFGSGTGESEILFDVTEFGGNLIAVGGRFTGEARSGPSVWSSPDGISWNRIFSSSFAAGETMSAVRANAGRVVAVGVSGGADSSTQDAALWTSVDGSSWERVRIPSFEGSGKQALYGIAPFGYGFIAVGEAESGRLGEDEDAAVWISSDGATWEPVTSPALGGQGEEKMTAVTVTGDGLVVGVGGVTMSGESRPAAWTSRNGREWRRVSSAALDAEDSLGMLSVTEGPKGVVAVGSVGEFRSQTGAAWHSRDGENWERAAVPPEPVRPQAISRVVSGGTEVVAVGYEAPSGAENGVVWISRDGSSWASQASPATSGSGSRAISGLTRLADRYIAVGFAVSAQEKPEPAVWVGTPSR